MVRATATIDHHGQRIAQRQEALRCGVSGDFVTKGHAGRDPVSTEQLADLEEVVTLAAIQRHDRRGVIHIEAVRTAQTLDPQAPFDCRVIVDAFEGVGNASRAVVVQQGDKALAQQDQVVRAVAAGDVQNVGTVIGRASIGHAHPVGLRCGVAQDMHMVRATLPVDQEAFARIPRTQLVQRDRILTSATQNSEVAHQINWPQRYAVRFGPALDRCGRRGDPALDQHVPASGVGIAHVKQKGNHAGLGLKCGSRLHHDLGCGVDRDVAQRHDRTVRPDHVQPLRRKPQSILDIHSLGHADGAARLNGQGTHNRCGNRQGRHMLQIGEGQVVRLGNPSPARADAQRQTVDPGRQRCCSPADRGRVKKGLFGDDRRLCTGRIKEARCGGEVHDILCLRPGHAQVGL